MRTLVVSSSLMVTGAREVCPYRRDSATVCIDLGGLAGDGWITVVTIEGPGPTRRIRMALSEAEVSTALVNDTLDVPQPGTVVVTIA